MLNFYKHWKASRKAAKELAAARAIRMDILKLVKDAEFRRDDRDLGRARMRLQEATTRELAAGRGL